MQTVLRQERKYLVRLPRMHQIRASLSGVMAADAHNGANGYRIRSLYFDTLDDRDFLDKEDGVALRRKIRLRVYDPCADYAMLEMKQKQGENQLKRSLKLSRQDAACLCRADYSPLLRYPDAFAAECYALMNSLCYRPKVVVEYRRQAFIAKENKIRVTIDSRISGTESCYDIFSPSLVQNPFLLPDLAVLEVKYNGFLLSYIKDILRMCDQSEISVSKYCLCRAASMHYAF